MNAIRQKLNSRRGASILIALLLFLVCAFVGSAVLAAAYQNISRAPAARREEQDYLAVASAAQLLKDEITGQKVELLDITTTYLDTEGNEYHTTNSKRLAQAYRGIFIILSQDALSSFKGAPSHSDRSITLDLPSRPELSQVQGTIRMGGDVSGYALTVELSNPDGSNEMELSFPVSIGTIDSHSDGGSVEDGTAYREHVNKTTVTWGRASVRLTSIPKEEST